MISSFLTPLLSARPKWPTCCSVRLSAIRAAQVIRLRSRLLRPGRSQTSPNSTSSVSSTNLGAKALSASCAAEAATGGLDTVSSYSGCWDPVLFLALPALRVRHEDIGAHRLERLVDGRRVVPGPAGILGL